MNDKKNKNTHGGARKGAGRKAMYAEMKAMKVPTQYIPVIKALIEHLNETEMIGFSSDDKPIINAYQKLFRSKQDKKQWVTFTTYNHTQRPPEVEEKKEEQLDLIEHIESKKDQ